MPERIRIILVDDHPLFREGVISILGEDDEIEVVAFGESADDAVSLAKAHLPDVILLDISMTGGGVLAAKEISSACPVVKIAMLTVSENDEDVLGSLKNGATGYILKGVSGSELIHIVKEIYKGNPYVSPALAARLLTDIKEDEDETKKTTTGVDDLSFREEQILQYISQGYSNREIGEAIGISEKTVKHYVTNILQKLQVRNRVEAAMLSRELVKQK